MARKLPFGDAYDLGDIETPDTSRLDKGLGLRGDPQPLGARGPQVGGSSSPEQLRARAAGFAPQATPVADALAAEKRGLTALTRRGGAALRAAAPALRAAGKVAGTAGVLENFNDYKLDPNDGVDSSAGGTLRALSSGDFKGAATSAGKGLLETGMDLGSFVANSADYLVPGQPVSQAYNRTLRNTFGDQLSDRSGNAGPPTADPRIGPLAPAPLAATSSPAAPNRTADPRIGPPAPSGAPVIGLPDGVRRQGNLYTDGSVRQPGEKTGFGGPEVAAIEQRARAIEAENSGIRAQADRYGPGAHNADGSGGFAVIGDSGNDAYAKLARERGTASALAGSSIKRNAREGLARLAGTDKALESLDRQGAAQAQSNQSNQGLRIAELKDATDRRGQDLSAGTARASGRLAAQKESQDAFEKERAYKLEVAKYGTQVADSNRAARDASQKNFIEQANTLFRDPEGKADTAKVAEFAGMVQQSLKPLADKLRAAGQTKKAADIEARGIDALDATDRADLKTLYERKLARQGNKGLVIGSSGANSSNLLDEVLTERDNTLLTEGYKTAGGGSVRTRHLDGTGFNPLASGNSDLLPTAEERARMGIR